MRFGVILNILTTVLAVYLLFNEFLTFLIIKPTQTSLELTPLTKKYFPAVIVCPDPAFNLTALKNEDYKSEWRVFTGNTGAHFDINSRNTSNVILWGGKNNVTQKKLLEKVALADNSSAWLSSWVKYEKWNNKVVGHHD